MIMTAFALLIAAMLVFIYHALQTPGNRLLAAGLALIAGAAAFFVAVFGKLFGG